jgi:hypothetical protein
MDHHDIDYPYDTFGNPKEWNLDWRENLSTEELIHWGYIDNPEDDRNEEHNGEDSRPDGCPF